MSQLDPNNDSREADTDLPRHASSSINMRGHRSAAFMDGQPTGPTVHRAGYFHPAPNVYPGHSWRFKSAPSETLPGRISAHDFPSLQDSGDASSTAATSTQQAASTWAGQFGLQGSEPTLPDGQAWLTPRFPSLRPRNTGGISRSERVHGYSVPKRMSPEQQDLLFCSEALQRSRFAGLTTAEAQLFTLEPVRFSPEPKVGGVAFDNRTSWFAIAFGGSLLNTMSAHRLDIFRHEKWVDLHGSDAEKDEKDPVGDGIWGWGNPKVRRALRPGLSLADAILKEALKGRWMQTVLGPHGNLKHVPETLKDGTVHNVCRLKRRRSEHLLQRPVGLSLIKNDPLPREYDAEDVAFGVDRIDMQSRNEKVPDAPDAGFWTKIKTDSWSHEALGELNEFSRNVIWTFYDRGCGPLGLDGEAGRGLFHVKTVTKPDPKYPKQYFVISLNTELLLPLLDDEASAMEKVLSIHTTAIVLLRGIITAISMWKCAKYHLDSIAYDKEDIADLPSSFENYTFGGKLDFPFHHDNATGGSRNGRALLITGSDWPNAGDWIRDHFPNSESWIDRLRLMHTNDPCQIRSQWFSYPIPGAWSVRLLKADTWADPDTRVDLKFPKHFKALTQRCAQALGSTHLESRTLPLEIPVQPRQNNPFMSKLRLIHKIEDRPRQQDPFAEDVLQIVNRLTARRAEWNKMRKPWYEPAQLAWSLTPYSMPHTRWILSQLKGWIQDQSLRSEHLAHELLHRFWLNGKPSANGEPHNWFYVAVGHMFAACLPCRRKPRKVQSEYDSEGSRPRRFNSLTAHMDFRGIGLRAVNDAFHVEIKATAYTNQVRHGGLDERKRHLRLARRMGEVYFFTRPHTRALKSAFMAALRNLEHQAREEMDESNWWVCQFALPAYEGASGSASEEQFKTFGVETCVTAKSQPLPCFRTAVGSAKQSTIAGGLEKWSKPTKADESYLQILHDNLYDRYWTVGEIADKVADHWLWVVEPDGGENGRFMVISLASKSALPLQSVCCADILKKEAMEKERKSSQDVDAMLEKGPYGYQCKGGSARHHFSPSTWKHFDKVGYVIQPVSWEMVHQNDGNNGKPLWIQIGHDVFDITNFPWYEFGGPDLATKLQKQTQYLNSSLLDPDDDFFSKYPAVLERLMPYRCATLQKSVVVDVPYSVPEMYLTREEVQWFEFPETGMYVVIDGLVYDVTEHVEIHPGGEELIRSHGGQDITNIFKEHHRDWQILLESPVLKSLVVGRIIPTRPHNQANLPLEDERSGYIWVKERFDDSKEHIVAKKLKRGGPLVRMRRRELEMCDGKDGDGWFNEGWVAVNDLVYNMTSVARYSKEPWIEALRKSMGASIQDAELAKHIWRRYAFRAVAMLEDEHAEDDYVLDKRRKDAAPRDYSFQLQKRDPMFFNGPPADIYLDEKNRPRSNIPNSDSLSTRYPFRAPKRRRPPAPYNDYATPFDKDTFLEQASSNYYLLLGEDAERRKGEEIDRREEEAKRAKWSDWGKWTIHAEERLESAAKEIHGREA